MNINNEYKSLLYIVDFLWNDSLSSNMSGKC